MKDTMTWWKWLILPFVVIFHTIRIALETLGLLLLPVTFLIVLLMVLKYLWLAL